MWNNFYSTNKYDWLHFKLWYFLNLELRYFSLFSAIIQFQPALNAIVNAVNWVDVGKTLREQGIDESETVLLRRKFFFSDQNIDSRDPVQLNLLYVQARDAILDGTHPVTQRKGKLLELYYSFVESNTRVHMSMHCICYTRILW